jgi:hypothetical protein
MRGSLGWNWDRNSQGIISDPRAIKERRDRETLYPFSIGECLKQEKG